MIAIPLYFQVTSSASNTVAGAHLFPAVAGNAIGGILSGIVIKRYVHPSTARFSVLNLMSLNSTGRYRNFSLFALFAASIGYLLLILRWHGHTNWLESMYILPGGFAMGVLSSSLFVHVQASIDPAHSAVATSTLYLSSNVGMLMGMSGTSAVLQGTLQGALERRLTDAGFVDKMKWKVGGHSDALVSFQLTFIADHQACSFGRALRGSCKASCWQNCC